MANLWRNWFVSYGAYLPANFLERQSRLMQQPGVPNRRRAKASNPVLSNTPRSDGKNMGTLFQSMAVSELCMKSCL
jgi:hypothetical protein